jgi:hypothetical protein
MSDNLSKVFFVLSDQGIPLQEELGSDARIEFAILQEGGMGCLDSGVDIFDCVCWGCGPYLARSGVYMGLLAVQAKHLGTHTIDIKSLSAL